MAELAPRCYDCLSYDVAVKVIGPHGFEHWFCAEDWAAEQALHDKIMAMLEDAQQKLLGDLDNWHPTGLGDLPASPVIAWPD